MTELDEDAPLGAQLMLETGLALSSPSTTNNHVAINMIMMLYFLEHPTYTFHSLMKEIIAQAEQRTAFRQQPGASLKTNYEKAYAAMIEYFSPVIRKQLPQQTKKRTRRRRNNIANGQK